MSDTDVDALGRSAGDRARMLLSILPAVPSTVTPDDKLLIDADDAMRLYRIAHAAAAFVRDVDREGRFDAFEAFQATIRAECRLR